MAKYDRSFLVPYLEDICSLHLYKNKLLRSKQAIQRQIDSVSCWTAGIKPTPPQVDKSDRFSPAFSLITLAVGALVFYLAVCDSDNFLIGLLQCFSGFIIFIAVAILGFGLYALGHEIFRVRANKKIDRENQLLYQMRLEKYNRALECDVARHNTQLPALQSELEKCNSEIASVTALLDKAYSANVIANQYRNIYAAVYLYEYFKSSGEDDVDSVLKLFVLEQIKAKLDVVIAQQTQIILNQRSMMAQQEAAMVQQERHHQEMRELAQQIAANQEEQTRYLSMVETNTATTAFFVTADYIDRHF